MLTTVLFFAFIIGLILSLVQIATDYWSQKEELSGTLEQLTESIQKPAANAVWFVDNGLAVGVVDGLMGYEPILSVKLLYEEGVLIERDRQLLEDPHHPIIRWLFGERYSQSLTLFAPEGDTTEEIGQVVLEVDPAYAGQSFIRRSLVVAASGIARTVLLSAVLLVLFLYTLTRPVLAVSRFVRAYSPQSSSHTPLDIDEKHLQGELHTLYEDTQALMSSVDNTQAKLEDEVSQRTQALALAKQSLDHVSAAVMTVDEHLTVIYANSALNQLFHPRNTSADSTELVGGSLANLLPQDTTFIQALQGVGQASVSTEVERDGRHFFLQANKVFDSKSSKWLGSTIEWRDLSEEKHMQEAVKQAVIAAKNGRLDKRLAVDCDSLFFREFNREVNDLFDVNSKVIKEVNSVLNSVISGDLTRSVDTPFQGAFGELKEHVNLTIDKLKSVISDISETAYTVDLGSREIKKANQSLIEYNQAFDHQLAETLTDMGVLTESIERNTQGIHQADELARDSRQKAENGAAVSQRVIEAIQQLQSSSQRIVNITQVINDISFQTNLLSLNAAVEAARAGAMGKGFAVVATEVQNLSLRSAEAAKEISDLTKDSVAKVDECTELVGESSKALNNIVDATQQVSGLVESVTQSSQRQVTNTHSMNQVVTGLHESTQKITELIQHADQTSQTMANQSSHLTGLVEFFNAAAA